MDFSRTGGTIPLKALPSVPVTDPLAQYQALGTEIREAINRVLDSGQYILGPEVSGFEEEFAAYLGTVEAVGVASGTDALALALTALGIGPGDEVITVSHTAVATVAAIEQSGATAVLVDVEPGHLTMDPACLSQVINARTRAIVPVHIYGRPADLNAIQTVCSKHGLALVEDASQAHGATFFGTRVGSFGDVGIFSCYPTKNLGALGDAGVIVTRDPQVAARLRRLREYGWRERNLSIETGVNSRLDELQAAILRVKLLHLDAGNARRRAVAGRYRSRLKGLPIELSPDRPGSESANHLFVVEVEERDNLRSRLRADGIDTAVHYPNPVHLQPAYIGRIRTACSMQVTEAAAGRILSLPMYPEIGDEAIDRVCSALARSVPLSLDRATTWSR
jgi:dTDP-4-amino-4,6-dideoxygalactose transaminase